MAHAETASLDAARLERLNALLECALELSRLGLRAARQTRIATLCVVDLLLEEL